MKPQMPYLKAEKVLVLSYTPYPAFHNVHICLRLGYRLEPSPLVKLAATDSGAAHLVQADHVLHPGVRPDLEGQRTCRRKPSKLDGVLQSQNVVMAMFVTIFCRGQH